MSFKDFNFHQEWLVERLAQFSIKTPTPVQANCIPPILAGRDCIGGAKTGSGKTMAFALPIIDKLLEDPYGIFAVVLTPTRELAIQIAHQFQLLGHPNNFKVCTIIGGMTMWRQAGELAKNPHIVIATPGRLADHVESYEDFNLKKVQILVMDEADRLLGGHFDEQLKTIMDSLPENRQELYFTATVDETVLAVKEELEKKKGKPVFVWEQDKLNDIVPTVEQLKQEYVLPLKRAMKDIYLTEVVRVYRQQQAGHGSVIIFTDTCKNCELLSRTLNEVGFDNVALHGMMKQRERTLSIDRFRSDKVKMLIATDLASRGLDIPTVDLVINHSIPKDPTDYIHRVGRTARAGRGGRAITIVDRDQEEVKLLQAIEQKINYKMTKFEVDDKKVAEIYMQVAVTRVKKKADLKTEKFDEKKVVNRRKKWLLQGLDPDKEEKKFLKRLKRNRNKKKTINPNKKQKVETKEESD